MSRSEFPESVKVKRLHFADFKCEGIVTREDGSKARCNATLVRSRVQFDHENPDGLTGKPTFENCRALCKICHAEKTKADIANIAQAKRREAAHVGARTAPVAKINSPGFAKSERTAAVEKRGPRQALPPRQLFVDR